MDRSAMSMCRHEPFERCFFFLLEIFDFCEPKFYEVFVELFVRVKGLTWL